MKIYLDNCMFNRPFDEQSHIRIRIETEAKLALQEDIRRGIYQLIWSYILDYENSKNPFQERKEQIIKWKKYAIIDVEENAEIIKMASLLNSKGLQKMDALHLACAIFAQAVYFITTDDKLIKKANTISQIKIIDPLDFIKKVFP